MIEKYLLADSINSFAVLNVIPFSELTEDLFTIRSYLPVVIYTNVG